MKLALHRSITFWSGLLVMAFICWAWRDSLQYASHADWGEAGVGQTNSYVSIRWIPNQTASAAERSNEASIYLPDVLPSPFFVQGREADYSGSSIRETLHSAAERGFASAARGTWALFLPHWLILLATAIPWLGLLVWRARRRAATTPGAQGQIV